MGILNINDDSFSGDGRVDVEWALDRAVAMIGEGADIVDVGAESARTNRDAIPERSEIARLTPFLQRFAESVARATPRGEDQVFPPLLSINTWRPAVSAAALEIAGDILNDMGGLVETDNAKIAAESGAALLIMHTQGAPKVTHTHVTYRDVLAEVLDFFKDRITRAVSAGVSRESIILDPGIDFAKQRDDNLQVLRQLKAITDLGAPVLMPVSRKTVIGDVLGIPVAGERDAGTMACVVSGMLRGASIFRVHNVSAAFETTLAVQRTLNGRA